MYSFGLNNDGQLGLGSTTTTATPTEIQELSDVNEVTAGTYFSAVMTSAGDVYTFGDDNYGQLGNGTETSSDTPEEITGVTAHDVGSGGFQLLVEKADGSLWATGWNAYGQLGNGTETNSETLVEVSGITDPAGLAGGGYDSWVLTGTGVIEGFGSNANGRLGNDATTDSDIPVPTDGFQASGMPSYDYTYDGDGLRMSVTTTSSSDPLGTTDQFTWDISGADPKLLSDGVNDYIYGPNGALIEQVNASGTYYVLTDIIGSTRVLTDSTGAVVGTATYSAYGVPSSASGLQSPIGFAGGYTDPTGLVYLVHRYYDPTTGQFLSVDPLVELTDQPYAYVYDDPVRSVDPSGMCGGWGWFTGECEAEVVVRGAQLGAKWVVHHPAETLGIVAGILAAATGVGALADATVLGLDASALAGISVGSGFVASGADIPGCVAGSIASCVGIAANMLGSGLGMGSLFAEEGTALFGLLSSQGFAVGIGASFWDVFSSLNANPTSGSGETSSSERC